MGYYGRGDYYGAGDYYRGDSIFSKIGRGLKNLAGTALSLSPFGGLVKTVASSVATVAGGGHPSLPQPKGMALQIAAQQQSGLINVGPSGGAQEGLINIATGQPSMVGVPGTKGYHLNKSTYETRGGGTSRWGGPGLQLHPKGSTLVKNRRMNVGNARALKRALRRAGGFARLARRVMSFTHPRAGRGHFKTSKRARR